MARLDRERRITTPFFIAMHVLACLSIPLGWLRGGHPERFGASVLLLDYLVSRVGDQWHVRDSDLVALTQDLGVMLIFGWLALRAARWWPLVVTAALASCVLVRGIGMVNPDLSRFAMLSAVLGFWLVAYTALLAGVVERRLAGETAVSAGKIWRRRRASGPDADLEGAAPSHPS